jgi:hypothetical protein
MLAEINVIGIIIAIVVTIVASLVKKKQPADEWELPPELKPRRDAAPQPPKVSRWEEELRRVLQEQSPQPPIVRQVPPPIPPVQEYQPEYEPHMQVELPTPQPQIEHAFQPLAGLTEATQRYTAATALEQRVQQHMQTVTTHRVLATSVQHKMLAPELREVMNSLHQPKGVRAAILASVILGPPRAFEI